MNIKTIISALLPATAIVATAQTDTLSLPQPPETGESVNVAFRTVDERDLMGGVSVVDIAGLTRKNYTTGSLDNMQAHVGGYTGSLWNVGNALVLVDGVPRDAANVLASEIEQITFMKAASAVVLYGSRAANGVILITTKRGHAAQLQVSVRGNAQLFVPKRYPKYLGSADYMTLYNEALRNDGKEPVYSNDDIWHYASGTNRYRYPEINFFSDDYLKKAYQRYDGTAEFSGGGRFAQFYANIGLSHQNDLMNFGEGKDNHTNRLNIRTNIDLQLNDWITGWLNANAVFSDARGDNSGFWNSSATLRPTSQYPLVPLIPISYIDQNDTQSQELIKNSNYVIDGKYLLGGTQNQQTNPFAAMYAAGYNKLTSRLLQFDTGIRLDLGKAVKGLSFLTRFGVDYSTSYITSIDNDYATYEAEWNNYGGDDRITALTKYGNDKRTGTQNVGGSYYQQTILWSGQFDYDRQFMQHNVHATLLANGWQQQATGTYHDTSNANLGLQFAYNYSHRYYADLSMALVHSAKLAKGHRKALSPVASVAWRLSDEPWMKGASGWIDDLKLNASYGVINQDIDINSYYMYDNVFTATGTYWGWAEGADNMQTSDSQRGSNEKLGFVKRKELRIGLDTKLWKGLISLNANFFVIETNGLLATPSAYLPNYYDTYYPRSSFLPYDNYNNQRRTGFDFTLNLHKRVGEVDLQLGLTGMAYSSKNTKVSETVEYEWLKAEGQPIDVMRGYRCLGFFQNEDEIAASAVINNNTRPGDLKYEDINNDGIIDSNDMVALGHWSADFYTGVNLTARWRNLTLYVNGTGSFGGKAFKDNSTSWVYGDRKYSDVVYGRWTEATAATATYPRLTTESGDLNFVNSDFWIYSTSAFRINRVQLTYDFPKMLFGNGFVKGLSVYLSGSDLLTIAKERKYMETNVGVAPQCRSYMLGAKIDF